MAQVPIWQAIVEKIIRWALFGIAISILPLIFVAIAATMTERNISLQSLLSHGELFLVSVGINVTSVDQLIGREGPMLKNTRLLLVGTSLLIALVASGWFAAVAVFIERGLPFDEYLAFGASIYIFVASVLLSLCSIVLSALLER